VSICQPGRFDVLVLSVILGAEPVCVAGVPTLAEAGLPDIHFHDLRHTGNILTSAASASLRELMARMGHTSTRPALAYLHDTDDCQRIIAAAVSDLAREKLAHLAGSPESPSGKVGAREGPDCPQGRS
jgi:hypothetical protein